MNNLGLIRITLKYNESLGITKDYYGITEKRLRIIKDYLQAPPLPPTPQPFDESTNRLTDDV